MGLRKPMKQEFGGSFREFVFEDKDKFEGADAVGGRGGIQMEDGEEEAQEWKGLGRFWQQGGWGKGKNDFGEQDGGFMRGRDFLSSEERQSIVHYMLLNLRAVEGDEVAGVKLHAGQAIGE